MDYCIVALVVLIVFAVADAMSLLFLLWGINWLLLLTAAWFIHIFTITVACKVSVMAAVLTMFLPVISEVYWSGVLWMERGTFVHPLAIASAVWLVMLGFHFGGRFVFAERIRALSNRPY